MIEALILVAFILALIYIEGGMRLAATVSGPVWYKMLIIFFWLPMIAIHHVRTRE